MIGEFIGDLLGGWFSALGGDAGLRRAATRLREKGMVLGAIRVRVGVVDGLSTRWHVRELTPASGSLSFGSTTLVVAAVYRRAEPLPTRDRLFLQPPDPLVVFDVQGEHAQLELAVPAEDADRSSRLLTPVAGAG